MSTNWRMIVDLAKKAGAKFPEVVGAQWALESGFGEHPSGRNNYFGLKGVAGQDTTNLKTLEQDAKGVASPENANFLNFDSVEECVNYLIKLWYRDYKGYKGVNRAETAEECIQLLQQEGYATDKKYASKLLGIYRNQIKKIEPAKKVEVKVAILYSMVAVQDTWLKKEPKQASELSEKDKVFVPKGRAYGVVKEIEVVRDSHFKVILAVGSGEWFVYGPHVSKKIKNIVKSDVVDWYNFSDEVSPNFTVGEVLQFDSRRRPKSDSADIARILKSVEQLQAIRDLWGRPIGVTSFYRPEPVNTQVGGARNSQHITGLAFDVYPVGGPLDAFYKWAFTRWTGGLGDGRARGFVHFDLRANGRLVPGAGVTPAYQWDY